MKHFYGFSYPHFMLICCFSGLDFEQGFKSSKRCRGWELQNSPWKPLLRGHIIEKRSWNLARLVLLRKLKLIRPKWRSSKRKLLKLLKILKSKQWNMKFARSKDLELKRTVMSFLLQKRNVMKYPWNAPRNCRTTLLELGHILLSKNSSVATLMESSSGSAEKLKPLMNF